MINGKWMQLGKIMRIAALCLVIAVALSIMGQKAHADPTTVQGNPDLYTFWGEALNKKKHPQMMGTATGSYNRTTALQQQYFANDVEPKINFNGSDFYFVEEIYPKGGGIYEIEVTKVVCRTELLTGIKYLTPYNGGKTMAMKFLVRRANPENILDTTFIVTPYSEPELPMPIVMLLSASVTNGVLVLRRRRNRGPNSC